MCTQIDPTCQYSDLIKMERFDPKFRLAGGINLPKILSCQCSDGKRRKQLLKVCVNS